MKLSKNILFKRQFLSQVLTVWSSDSDRKFIANLFLLEPSCFLLSWLQKGRYTYSRTGVPLPDSYPNSSLSELMSVCANELRHLGTAAGKVPIACFLCFAGDSRSY